MLVIILIFLNINLICADESGSGETKLIDLLPEREKKEFIETIARRIMEEVDAVKHNDTKLVSGEVLDSQLNAHSEYVKKLLKEEAVNLKDRVINGKRETRDVNEKGKKDRADNIDRKDNENIDLTLHDKSKENIDLTLRNRLTTDDPDIKATNKNQPSKSDNINAENLSIDIQIVDDNKTRIASNLNQEIPVKVVYDDETTSSSSKINRNPNIAKEKDKISTLSSKIKSGDVWTHKNDFKSKVQTKDKQQSEDILQDIIKLRAQNGEKDANIPTRTPRSIALKLKENNSKLKTDKKPSRRIFEADQVINATESDSEISAKTIELVALKGNKTSDVLSIPIINSTENETTLNADYLKINLDEEEGTISDNTTKIIPLIQSDEEHNNKERNLITSSTSEPRTIKVDLDKVNDTRAEFPKNTINPVKFKKDEGVVNKHTEIVNATVYEQSTTVTSDIDNTVIYTDTSITTAVSARSSPITAPQVSKTNTTSSPTEDIIRVESKHIESQDETPEITIEIDLSNASKLIGVKDKNMTNKDILPTKVEYRTENIIWNDTDMTHKKALQNNETVSENEGTRTENDKDLLISLDDEDKTDNLKDINSLQEINVEPADAVVNYITTAKTPVLTTNALKEPLVRENSVVVDDNELEIERHGKNKEKERPNLRMREVKHRQGRVELKPVKYNVYELLPGQDPFVEVDKLQSNLKETPKKLTPQNLANRLKLKETDDIKQDIFVELNKLLQSNRNEKFKKVNTNWNQKSKNTKSKDLSKLIQVKMNTKAEEPYPLDAVIQYDEKTQVEQPNYAPIYNYAPDNAYYNPQNKYGPNPNYIDINEANGDSHDLLDLEDVLEKEPKLIASPKQKHKKLIDIKKAFDNDNVDLDYYFGFHDTAGRKGKPSRESEEVTFLRKGKRINKIPDSHDIDHPRNAMFYNDVPTTHMDKVKDILAGLGYYGYKHILAQEAAKKPVNFEEEAEEDKPKKKNKKKKNQEDLDTVEREISKGIEKGKKHYDKDISEGIEKGKKHYDKDISESIEKGKKHYDKGKKHYDKGKNLYKKGKDYIGKGKKYIEEGKELVDEGKEHVEEEKEIIKHVTVTPKPIEIEKDAMRTKKLNNVNDKYTVNIANKARGYKYRGLPNIVNRSRQHSHNHPLIIMTGDSTTLEDLIKRVSKKIKSSKPDFDEDYYFGRKHDAQIKLRFDSLEYDHYADTVSARSSESIETNFELNVGAIEAMLKDPKADNVLAKLKAMNKLYVAVNGTDEGKKKKQSSEESKESVLRIKSEFTPYVTVLKDMFAADSRALQNYDWLGTTVTIRSAVKKLGDLSDSLKANEKVHPADLQMLKYILYLYKSAKEEVDRGFRRNYFSNFLNNFEEEPMQRPWLAMEGMEDQIEEFKAFLDAVETALNELHDAIKHIALVTKYKSQRWYNNLKELYFNDPTREQYLQFTLHLLVTRLLGVIEDAMADGLAGNYVKYAMQHPKDVDNARSEFVSVIKLLNEIFKTY